MKSTQLKRIAERERVRGEGVGEIKLRRVNESLSEEQMSKKAMEKRHKTIHTYHHIQSNIGEMLL